MSAEHVFVRAREHVSDWPRSRWHTGIGSPNSSQALCVSVWGTLASHPERDSILEEILDLAGLHVGTPRATRITCEAGADGTLAHLLNEVGGNTTPTCVDALIQWPGATIAVESKFTETGFGGCRPVRPRVRRSGFRLRAVAATASDPTRRP
jgi:hypothetical protein